MKPIEGGVCASLGFRAGAIHAGIKKNSEKLDIALIVSDYLASAACVYTTNLVEGAPIRVTKTHVANGFAQAIICNSGNANTCNADGEEIASKTCALLAEELKMKEDDIIVASTGVIGQPLSIVPFEKGMKALVESLGTTPSHSAMAEKAIMTTDTKPKEIAYEFMLGNQICHIGGMTKGSGMIHPNMATMLSFITSDVFITPALLDKALKTCVVDTFNMVSVDGDTSTNDMVSVLANGASNNTLIDTENEDYHSFLEALYEVMTYLSKEIAKDGEGATKLLICQVQGAPTKADARIVAKSVICSSLLKAAMFGADANWGRVLCAIGYSGANVDVKKISVSFSSLKGQIKVCEHGAGIPFDEEIAKEILSESEITIDIHLNVGDYKGTSYGCDLTYDYVKINGDYRS